MADTTNKILTKVELDSTQAQIQIAKLSATASDTTKTLEERISAKNKEVEIQEQLSKKNIATLEKEIKLLREAGASEKEVEKAISKLNKEKIKATKVSERNTKQNNKLNKSLSDSKKKGKEGGSGLNLFGKGIKGIGTAIKAAGIGILIAVLGAVFEIMRKNQKVLDAIETATNFIAVGFKAVSDAVTGAYASVSESTGGFDALGKVMSGLLTIAITPLKLGFYELKLAMQVLKVGYETMFGSDESVKKAKADLEETKLAIVNVANDAVKAGKDIYNNIGEAVSEVSEGTKAVVNNISKIDPKKVLDQASNMTKLGNESEIAASKQAGLVEEFDRQAETQRQIRDDESLSIEARKKANDELGRILEKQEKAMLKQADAQLASAKAQYEVNGNQENYVALIDAETNRKGVLAQINGFTSEQKVNAVALQKEEIELTESQKEAETSLAFEKKRFAAEQITDDELRIATLIAINEEERLAEVKRLEEKRDNFKKGTQAYVDAQIELNAKKAEFAQTDADLRLQEKLRKSLELQEDIDNDSLSFDERRNRLRAQRRAILFDESLSAKERKNMLEANSNAIKSIDTAEVEHKERGFAQVANAMSAFSDIAGKETSAGKALAVAGALINTYLGATQVLRDETLPTFGKIAGVAAVLASGFKSIKQITSTKVPGGGGGGNPNPSIAPNSQPNTLGSLRGSGGGNIAQTQSVSDLSANNTSRLGVNSSISDNATASALRNNQSGGGGSKVAFYEGTYQEFRRGIDFRDGHSTIGG